MMKTGSTLAAASVALAAFVSTAWADDASAVQNFYDLLSNPGSADHAAAFSSTTAEDWVSVGDYSGENKTREAFLGQMGGFAQLLPDLNWAIEAMHQDGNFVVVRSRATGTPAGPLFGVDGEGRSFEMMTIDIHELAGGKIIRTYHVEDWAGALQQLSGQ
jgi:predicted ester cyclase